MHEYKINDNTTLYWLGHAGFKIKTENVTNCGFSLNVEVKTPIMFIVCNSYIGKYMIYIIIFAGFLFASFEILEL